MSNYWTAFDWGKYERKTAHLSVTEHGAYFLLLKHYYQSGNPLPANIDTLMRVCRAITELEREAVKTVLAEFFTLESDGYHNQTADEEIAKSASIVQGHSKGGLASASMLTSEQRSERARGAAKSRWQKQRTYAENNANSMLTGCLLDAKQSQLQSHKTLSPTPFPNSDAKIFEIAKAHPKLSHLRDETEIPRAVADAIIRAVSADGYEKVRDGTLAYARSLDDPKFARKPWDFFHEFEYRQDHRPKTYGTSRQEAARRAMDEAFSE